MTPPLSHGELRQMEEAAKNKPGVRGGKVPFPIVVDTETIFKEVRNDLDEKIMQAVINVGITVNKPELIRALELDRKVREGKLVEVTRCKDCKYCTDYGDMLYCDSQDIHVDGGYTEPHFYCSFGRRKEKTDG